MPEIQKQAAQVHVFQRTPPWVMPHPSREIRGWEKRLYDRVRALQKLVAAVSTRAAGCSCSASSSTRG